MISSNVALQALATLEVPARGQKGCNHPSWLTHVPNRRNLAWLFAMKGLKATLHALPGSWEQPFLCRSSPQPVFMPGTCFDGNTDRWWVSDSYSADKIKKSLQWFGFLVDIDFTLRYSLD